MNNNSLIVFLGSIAFAVSLAVGLATGLKEMNDPKVIFIPVPVPPPSPVPVPPPSPSPAPIPVPIPVPSPTPASNLTLPAQTSYITNTGPFCVYADFLGSQREIVVTNATSVVTYESNVAAWTFEIVDAPRSCDDGADKAFYRRVEFGNVTGSYLDVDVTVQGLVVYNINFAENARLNLLLFDADGEFVREYRGGIQRITNIFPNFWQISVHALIPADIISPGSTLRLFMRVQTSSTEDLTFEDDSASVTATSAWRIRLTV